MALFGLSVAAIAYLVHETAHAHMVPAGQGGVAGKGCRRTTPPDYSGVVRIEIDDTARKRNQSYISIMANFDHQRA